MSETVKTTKATKATKPAPFKIPKKIGEVADLLYAIRQERLAKQKEVDELASRETALKNHIIENLPKSEATGAAGKTANVRVVIKQKPQVKDWDALYAYVSKTKSFDLLQRRLSDKAVTDRWENSKTVPGVEAVPVVDVSVTKV